MLFSLAICGCSPAAQPQASSHPALSPPRQAVQDPSGAIGLTDATVATWLADFDRVPDDIYRSIRDLGWGRMDITPPQEQADPAYPQASDAVQLRSVPLVRAQALTPDGRQATVLAWPVPRSQPPQITVAVRIGHFGDPLQEQQFLTKLKKLLAANPRPKRDARFHLPQ